MMKNTQNIFLCGFMGCGKSTVGRMLAKRMGLKFFDLDKYIEKDTQMKIAEIFSFFGEEHFRKLETEAIRNFSDKRCVVATGGGALLSKENAAIANSIGTVVYIDTPFDVCYERIKGDERRPLAFKSSREELKALYLSRQPLYKENSVCCVSGLDSPLIIAERIEQSLGAIK